MDAVVGMILDDDRASAYGKVSKVLDDKHCVAVQHSHGDPVAGGGVKIYVVLVVAAVHDKVEVAYDGHVPYREDFPSFETVACTFDYYVN